MLANEFFTVFDRRSNDSTADDLRMVLFSGRLNEGINFPRPVTLADGPKLFWVRIQRIAVAKKVHLVDRIITQPYNLKMFRKSSFEFSKGGIVLDNKETPQVDLDHSRVRRRL